MNKKHLHQLLTRYRSGNCTEQEKRLAEQWFALIEGEESHHSDQEYGQIEDRIWNAIQGERGNVTSVNAKVLPLLLRWRWAAAAVLVVMLLGGYLVNKNSRSRERSFAGEMSAGMTSRENNTSAPILVALEDGTRVNLLPGSRIQYPTRFGSGSRTVYLRGKAFFDVTKDPAHPFVVYAGVIATRVLGTSFWIDAHHQTKSVEVSVVTGKVAVFEHLKNDIKNGSEQSVTLTPNQRVSYFTENQSFVKSLASEPVMLDAYAENFVFTDVPMGKVAALLEKAYGIEIELENDKLKNCLFTADISKQPLFTKLDLISSSVNGSYQVMGTKILLSGKGCSKN